MIEEKALDDWMEAFGKMNRAVIRGIKAPHKPLLLLAILHLVQRGIIVSNRITLSEELIREFKHLWTQYIGSADDRESFQVSEGLMLDLALRYPFKCSIVNPFYHLQHEAFWRLVKGEGYKVRKNYTSIKQLRACFAYAEMDEGLFRAMKDEKNSQAIADNLVGLVME